MFDTIELRIEPADTSETAVARRAISECAMTNDNLRKVMISLACDWGSLGSHCLRNGCSGGRKAVYMYLQRVSDLYQLKDCLQFL